jgi:DNA-binding HxlR family transcriptional regulator
LSERLKELETEGIVERIVIPETPVRIEYRLTCKGTSLDNVMDAISDWAHDWVVPDMQTESDPSAAVTSHR